jgi:hypothetical protein
MVLLLSKWRICAGEGVRIVRAGADRINAQ